MRISARILWTLTLLAALTGCRKGVEPIRFTAGVADWEGTEFAALPQGAAVGILSASPVDIPNVRATYSGGELIPDVALYWEAGQRTETAFYGYSPYDASVTGLPFVFAVKEDQRTESAYSASDLVASSALVSPGLRVRFHLKHKMSRLVVKVNGETAETGTVRAVSLKNAPRSGTMTEIDKGLSEVSDPGYVRALPKEDKRYWALFVPSSVKLVFEVETTQNKLYTCSLPAEESFLSGKSYFTEITLSDATVTTGDLVFTVSVSDWSDGGSLPMKP